MWPNIPTNINQLRSEIWTALQEILSWKAISARFRDLKRPNHSLTELTEARVHNVRLRPKVSGGQTVLTEVVGPLDHLVNFDAHLRHGAGIK